MITWGRCAADDLDQLAHRLVQRGPGEAAGSALASRVGHPRVAVAEQDDLVVADDLGRPRQLLHADLVQPLPHLGRVHGRVEDVALLATGAAHEHGAHALGVVAGDRAARPSTPRRRGGRGPSAGRGGRRSARNATGDATGPRPVGRPTTSPGALGPSDRVRAGQPYFEDAVRHHRPRRRDLYEVLTTTYREISVAGPGAHGQRRAASSSGATASSTTAPAGPYKGGIRYHPDRRPRRGAGPRLADDVEDRAARHPLRRGQGRHRSRPDAADASRARAHDPPVHAAPSATSSASTATSPPPTSTPTRRRWPG